LCRTAGIVPIAAVVTLDDDVMEVHFGHPRADAIGEDSVVAC
jgi:hypothetical protein